MRWDVVMQTKTLFPSWCYSIYHYEGCFWYHQMTAIITAIITDIITAIINSSLVSGIVPASFKHAFVQPLLKKLTWYIFL